MPFKVINALEVRVSSKGRVHVRGEVDIGVAIHDLDSESCSCLGQQ